MALQCKSFEDLTWQRIQFFDQKIKQNTGNSTSLSLSLGKIKRYMDTKNITQFDAVVGKRFLLERFGNKDYAKLGKSEKDLVRAVTILRQFCSTGAIEPIKMQSTFEGSIGVAMVDYLAYRTASQVKSTYYRRK